MDCPLTRAKEANMTITRADAERMDFSDVSNGERAVTAATCRA